MAGPAQQSAAHAPGRAERQDPPIVRAFDTLREAEQLRLAGKHDRARSVCALALKEFPDYVGALHTMGLILADQTHYDKALEYLHRALMLNPTDPKVLTGLSGVYLRLGSDLMAARTLEQALEAQPKDVNILVTLGEIYREQKEYEFSKDAYQAALEIEPDLVVAQIGLARNLAQIGELQQAAEIYEKHIRAGSRALNHLLALGALPAQFVNLDILPLLDETVQPPKRLPPDEFKSHIAFAKALALDAAGRYEEAWEQVNRARRYNAAQNKKGYTNYRQRFEPLLKMARDAPEITGARLRESPDQPVSLFIAGPSRSGKTTLERLIGSLPGVKRGYENPIVENTVRRTFQTAGFPTFSMLPQMPPGLGDSFRVFYGEELARRADSSKVFTNTLPGRAEDAVRAAAEIPNARFVFVKRDVEDLSIRIFMKNYAGGNYYSSSVANIRDFLTWGHEMMDVMAAKMPEVARVITYEEMIADPAAALNMTAELCGLDASGAEIPKVGDDRGCAEPYREKMKAAIGA